MSRTAAIPASTPKPSICRPPLHTWTVDPASLAGLTMTVPVGTPDFTLTVTATATEGANGAQAVSTLTIPVDTANPPEILGTVTLSGDEDIPLTFSLADLLAAAWDVERGDALSVLNLTVAPSGVPGVVEDNGDDTWTFTPEANWFGSFDLVYTISDGVTALPVRATVTINAVNDAPEFSSLDPLTLTGFEDGGTVWISSYDLLANATDADDGDTLSVVNVTLSDPTAGTFDTSYAGWWGFTPNADWHGAQ